TGTNVTSANNSGVWFEGAAGLRLVVRAGDPSPGTGPGVVFGSSLSVLGFNDNRQVVFEGGLSGMGVTTSNSVGYWSGGAGSLALVLRAGDPAPGTAAGTTFQIVESNVPVGFNNAGHVVARAGLSGPTIGTLNNSGIWSNRSGSLELVAAAGNQ